MTQQGIPFEICLRTRKLTVAPEHEDEFNLRLARWAVRIAVEAERTRLLPFTDAVAKAEAEYNAALDLLLASPASEMQKLAEACCAAGSRCEAAREALDEARRSRPRAQPSDPEPEFSDEDGSAGEAPRQIGSANERDIGPLARSSDCSRKGLVYFCRAEGTPYVKVGFASDPEKRRAELRTGSPHQLTIVATFVGTMRVEKLLHALLADRRVTGEWFCLTDAEVNAWSGIM